MKERRRLGWRFLEFDEQKHQGSQNHQRDPTGGGKRRGKGNEGNGETGEKERREGILLLRPTGTFIYEHTFGCGCLGGPRSSMRADMSRWEL